MRLNFYAKFAADNLRKNPRLYVPRILSQAGLLGCFYILFALATDDRMSQVLGGSYLPTLMSMGAVVLGLLSLMLVFYINSFLMKQRKSEYGLYNVLGMEKRHIVRVLFFESLYSLTASLVIGIVFGLLFYKASSLFICKLLQSEAVAGFYYINASTLLFPILFFIGLDAAVFVLNTVVSIYRLKPVELLAGKHTGEREPKIKWLLLIIGVLTLGAGYTIALTVESPLAALLLFFAAVILVIIGTYCLFVSGTVFILKCLKKNKKYYYRKRHMPAVSGLLFRMKQNAVGLASIAVLSTGVLIMVSCSVSLHCGVEDTMDASYPREMYLSAYRVDAEKLIPVSYDTLSRVVKNAAEENNVAINGIQNERYLSVSYVMRDGKLLAKTEVTGGWMTNEITEVLFITEETYRELTGKIIAEEKTNASLSSDEIIYCRISSTAEGIAESPDSIFVAGNTFRVKDTLLYFPIQGGLRGIVNCIGVVVSDETVLNNIFLAQKEAYGEYASEYINRISVSFEEEEAAFAAGAGIDEAVFRGLKEECGENIIVSLDTKWDSKANVLGMYGSFLFLGILLGLVFLFATILIIYYKQISEGYDDRERFQIMQKIGMEEREVKKTIDSQLQLQFFLPLVTAGIHTAVAFPILLKLLKILMLTNTALFIVCTVACFAVFALVYTVVYLLTSKTYYKIVH